MSHQDLDKYSIRNFYFYFEFNQHKYNKYYWKIALIQKKTIQRTCKGPVSIKRIDPKGDYIVIENTCIKKVKTITNYISFLT